MKMPAFGERTARAPANSLLARLIWMAGIWAAGVACVFVVSLVLRLVLHR